MRKPILFILFVIYPILLGTLYGQTRGYTARACGLDMNRNGIIGEVADCNVCDGTTTDVDGDGFDEDLYYVDSVSGTDAASCGTTGSPCKTISYTIDNEVDGPGTGQEDIVCIQGTFLENIDNLQSGIAGSYTVSATGSQVYDFEYPDNPFMIVGWDTDNDGSYPPFDTDETALLDGQGAVVTAFDNGADDDSYWELAHFSVKDYAQDFINTGRSTAGISHIYLHDIEADGIVKGITAQTGGNRRAYNMFIFDLNWFANQNMKFTNQGSYFARGGVGSTSVDNNWRWQNITVTYFGDPTGNIQGFKIWGLIDKIEILDSIFDVDPTAWSATTSPGNNNTGIVPAQCSQNWKIINNELIDWSFGILIQPETSGSCTTRGVTGTVIDQNRISNSYEWTPGGLAGIEIRSGGTAGNTLEDVVITNNFISTTVLAQEYHIHSFSGSTTGPNPGNITIAGNTFFGDVKTASFRVHNLAGEAFPTLNYTFRNNITTGLASNHENVTTNYNVTGWVADGNVYDAGADHIWSGTRETTFAGWQSASGNDTNSTECDPAFINAGAGDLHLLNNDLCAIGGGVDISAITTKDIDGQTRSSTSPDSGADEVMGSSSAPSPPANLRGTAN